MCIGCHTCCLGFSPTFWIFWSNSKSFMCSICIILLAWNVMCYSFPFLRFVLLCCCVALISTLLLDYNMNMASFDDQSSQLPSWRHKEARANEWHIHKWSATSCMVSSFKFLWVFIRFILVGILLIMVKTPWGRYCFNNLRT